MMVDPKLYFVFLAFAISFGLGWYVIPRIVLISKRKRLFDKIDARKKATAPTPRLGGIAFFPIAMFSFTLVLGFRYLLEFDIPESMESNLLLITMFASAGFVLIFFIGLADDLIEVSYKTKFLVQFFCASLLMFAGLWISNLEGLFFINQIPSIVGIILTILFVVYTINAFNLIDGVNGLCSGLSIIILSAFGAWFIYTESFVYAMLAFSMVGVVLAFFYFNVKGKRLRIFMGDTGSLTLGFMVSFLALKFIAGEDTSGIHYEPASRLALVAGLLFVPLFDTFRVFLGRISKGLSPFHPDRTHIHHKLLNAGLTHIQSTITLLLTQLFYLLINILMSEILMLNNNLILAVDIALAFAFLSFIQKAIVRREKK